MKANRELLLFILVASLVDYVCCGFIKSRRWHEEYITHFDNGNVLYPRYKVCVGPKEKAEITSKKVMQSPSLRKEVLWSDLLSMYSSDSGAEIYNWDYTKQKVDPEKSTHMEEVVCIILFLLSFLGMVFIFIFTVPIFGCIGFKFYSLVWRSIFHPELRRFFRRIFIMKEQLLHKCRHRVAKRRHHLPYILREFNEEDTPAELMYEEESDTEVFLDGMDDLYAPMDEKDAKGTKVKSQSQNDITISKNLAYIIEQELGSKQNVAEAPAQAPAPAPAP